jgi:hypothetical protein
MTFEAIIGVSAVLALLAAIMVVVIHRGQRESQQIMEAYEAGDRMAVRRGIVSGVIAFTGIVAMIGYEDGVEGVITVFAILAAFFGVFIFAWCAFHLWRHRKKRDDLSPGPDSQYNNRLRLGGMLLAGAAFVAGTATLVELHGATTIVIYYVAGSEFLPKRRAWLRPSIRRSPLFIMLKTPITFPDSTLQRWVRVFRSPIKTKLTSARMG